MLPPARPHADISFSADEGLGLFLGVLMLVLLILVHVACGIAILDDTRRYAEKHGQPVLLTRAMWGLVGFATGILGLAVYWAMHRSALQPHNASPPPA